MDKIRKRNDTTWTPSGEVKAKARVKARGISVVIAVDERDTSRETAPPRARVKEETQEA